MAVVQATQHHHHPAFDISRHKKNALVFDYLLEIRVKVLEHQVQIGLVRKHINELNDIGVLEFL
jgi:preprotein translocase subunit SecA